MAETSAARAMGDQTSPQRVEPMLAFSAPEPFDSPDHLFEVKWDGIRAIAVVDGGDVRLHTRGGRDLTHAFEDLCESLRKSVHTSGVVLDGEIVSLDSNGLPRLGRVVQRLQPTSRQRRRIPVTYQVFDMLYARNRSLMRQPLWRRKSALHGTVSPNSIVHVCRFEEECGTALYEATRQIGIEGIMAKEKGSLYHPGKRSGEWLKVKHSRSGNLVVGGYTLGGNTRREPFASLLLGVYQDGLLRYVGNVSGGFSNADFKTIYQFLSDIHTERSPFADPPKMDRLLYWCEPRLALQVTYGERTAAGRLRFPIFTALRPDIAPAECTIDALD